MKFAEYLRDVVKGSYRPQKFGEAVEEGARLLAGHDDLLNRLEETMDSVIAASDGKLKRPTIAQIAKKLDGINGLKINYSQNNLRIRFSSTKESVGF